MNRIKFGDFVIELNDSADIEKTLRSLFIPMNDQEIANYLGVSDRTVSRYKKAEIFGFRKGMRMTMYDIIKNRDEKGKK